jgi:hypothetical protein
LPLEVASHYLEITTGAFVNATVKSGNETIDNVDFLQTITKPVSSLIVQLDSKTLNAFATDPDGAANKSLSLIKHTCSGKNNTKIPCKY